MRFVKQIVFFNTIISIENKEVSLLQVAYSKIMTVLKIKSIDRKVSGSQGMSLFAIKIGLQILIFLKSSIAVWWET